MNGISLAYNGLGPEERRAVSEVMKSGRITMGQKTEEFEEAFARYIGRKYAIMVNSGSSANLVMVAALDMPGKSILAPALTWPTTIWPCLQAGMRVDFHDVDLDTLCLPPGIDHEIVFAVHLMGNAADVDTFACDILLEDCCEALGSLMYDDSNEWVKVGRFGHMASFSFFFSHHMTTGEGGMIVTDDRDLADRCRAIRSHGWIRGHSREEELAAQHSGIDPKFLFIVQGYNVRPTEIQAAIGIVQLKKLDAMNSARRTLWNSMMDLINPHHEWLRPILRIERSAPFAFPVLCEKRSELMACLGQHGIETRPIAGGNLMRQPAFADAIQNGRCRAVISAYGRGPAPTDSLPATDYIHENGLYWGCHPGVDEAGIARLDEALKSFGERHVR